MEKEWIGSITSWMVSPSKDTITKHGIFVYMLKWFCSAEHVHVTCLTWPHSETRLVWMVSNHPSLMEALLRGGEEGNRILILGWLLLKSRKIADAWYPFFCNDQKAVATVVRFWYEIRMHLLPRTDLVHHVPHRLQTEVARWANCYVALPYVGTNLHLNWSIYCPMTLLSRILFLIC